MTSPSSPKERRLIRVAPELLKFVEKYVAETNCFCRLNKILGVFTTCPHCEAKQLVKKVGPR